MKKYNSKLIAFVILAFCFLPSCDEQALLNEVPKDFYSPENSYSKPEHFELAFAYIYTYTRATFYGDEDKNNLSIYLTRY